MSLEIVPLTLKAANAYVEQLHRHHGRTVGHKFSIGVNRDGELCGVAIAGRPVARGLDDGRTLEVLRVCTDGTPNACSMLYGAIRRAGKAMGYTRFVTYTLATEEGGSLRAAGWIIDGTVPGRSWDTPTRRRVDSHPTVDKLRWRAA